MRLRLFQIDAFTSRRLALDFPPLLGKLEGVIELKRP